MREGWSGWMKASSSRSHSRSPPQQNTVRLTPPLAGDAKVGGFTNSWGVRDLNDEDISEECRASRWGTRLPEMRNAVRLFAYSLD